MHTTSRLPLAALALSLTIWLCSCATSQPIVRTRTVTVQVPAYVPLNATLIAPVRMPVPDAGPITYDQVIELAVQRGRAIDQANAQLDAIRRLQPGAR